MRSDYKEILAAGLISLQIVRSPDNGFAVSCQWFVERLTYSILRYSKSRDSLPQEVIKW